MFHAQTTVVVDLLGELNIPGLESLQLFLMENTHREYVHFSESDSVTVKDFYVRRLMNRVNSLPKGHEYNPWSESLHIAHDVSHMRQIFAPTKGFQDRQKDTQQTDSPAASRSGFRCATQFAANCQWDLYHMDLKTAFLQGEAYDETRDIICQIPSECGYPPYIGAKMKKSAYGLNDAPQMVAGCR